MLITTKRQSTILVNKLKQRIRDCNKQLDNNYEDVVYLKKVITSLIDVSIVNVDLSFFKYSMDDETLFYKVLYFLDQQTEHDSNRLLMINMINFKEVLLNRLNLIKKKHSTIVLLSKILDLDIHAFIKTIYFEMSIQVLRGRTIDLGIYNLTVIPFRNDPTGKTARRKINWAESIKYKKQLIAEGKVPYKQYERDDGIKWFVYHTDTYAHYAQLYVNGRGNKLQFEHKYTYNIIPFAFVHTEQLEGRLHTPTRIKQDFLDKCESNEDIINCRKLGFVDRLYYLLAYDKDYYLNFKNRRENEYRKFKRSFS